MKRKGRKAKGAKLSVTMNGNVESNNVAPKSDKHESNLMCKRRSNRLRKNAMKATLRSEDNDDEVEDITTSVQIQIIKSNDVVI